MRYLRSLLISFILCTTISHAQSGLFVAPNSAAITSPVSGATWLFNTSNNTISVWNGSAYQAVNAAFSNLTATVAPTAHNDSTQGYVVGSYWFNQTSQVLYFCAVNTASAAVWVGVNAITSTVPLANIAQGGATNGQSLLWNNGSGVWAPGNPAINLNQLTQSGATSGQTINWNGSAWIASNAGAGSVTSVTSGNLSPLFNVSVANSTSTPVFSFSLLNAASHAILSNPAGSSGVPSYNVLSLTAGTGLSGGGDLTTSPTISLTSPVAIANGGTGAATATSHTWFGNNTSSTAAPGFQTIGVSDLPNTVVTGVNNTSTLINASITGQTLSLSNNGALTIALSQLTQSGATSGQVIAWNGSAWAPSSAGSGTVSSVGLTGDGVIFNSSVSGSPVTGSGTLVPALLTQSPNTFLAGPGSGSAATPTFRAITTTDLPSFLVANSGNLSPLFTTGISGQTLNFTLSNAAGNGILSNTSGSTAAPAYNVLSITAGTGLSGGGNLASSPTISLTSPVAVANGGSGLTSAPSNGQLLIGNGTGYTLSTISAGNNVSITNGAGSITVNSSFNFAVQSQSSNFNAAPNTQYFVNLSSGNVIATLPDATVNTGANIRTFVSVIGGSNTLTFATTSAQTINGVSPGSITPLSTLGNTYTFTSDGSNWWIACKN